MATSMTTTQRATLVATGIGLFMIFLDALIVNVALPDIQASFGVGESGLQWVVTAYSIGMAVFMMSSATVADLTGRRRLYLVALVVFTMASVACGLAPTMLVLNLSRTVQGIAAAAVNVTSLALVSAAFPDPGQKARAIGIWTGIASIATAIGPTAGGLLTESLGWRSIFWVNVPFDVAAVVLTLRYVAESRDPSERSFDIGGQVLFALVIGTFAFGVIEGPQQGWLDPVILACFAVAVVAWVAFVRYELAQRTPMMDVRLFADRTYSLAIGTIFVAFFSVYGMLLVVTQYFQNVRDFSPATAGLLLLPFSAGVVVMSPIAGRIVGRTGHRTPILAGTSLLLVGLVLETAGMSLATAVVMAGLGCVGVGAALVLTPVTSLAMTSVPEERAGMASGIMSAQRAIGSTVGFAVLGSILAVWLSATLDTDLASTIPDDAQREALTTEIVDDADPRAYSSEIGPGRPITSESASTEAEILAVADDAFVAGIQIALAVAAGLIAIVLVVGVVAFPHGDASTRGAEAEAEALHAEEAAAEATADGEADRGAGPWAPPQPGG
ncbi:MAG: MFS transporter [Acidimicrobiales bacterium]|nr:MFS transporter [Acidimicrobiales bacterium]